MNFNAGMGIYGLNFSNRKLRHSQEESQNESGESVLIGVTSCVQPSNCVMVLEMNEETMDIQKVVEQEEYYPCTKI